MIKEKIAKITKDYKTIKMEKVEETGFLNIEKYKCYLNNGEVITREKITKGGKDGSAAIVLPLTKNNKVIVGIEPRVFTDTTASIDLPAGYIEKDEEGVDAAKRELLEETGYTSDEFQFLGKFYQDLGISAACNEYYLALNCQKTRKQKLDKDEFIKTIEITIDELLYLLDNGYIKSLNSAYIIEKCRPYLERIK